MNHNTQLQQNTQLQNTQLQNTQLLQFSYTPTNHKLAVLMDDICRRYGVPQLFNAISRSQCDTTAHYGNYFITWRVNNFNMRVIDIPEYYKGIFSEFVAATTTDSGRFIAFPILMTHPKSIFKPQTTEGCFLNLNHVSMLVYDKQFGYLERFDSGNNVHLYDGELLDTVLVSSFQNTFGITVRGYLTPWMICQKHGIQALQEAEIYNANIPAVLGVTIGFCSVYSLWYLEQRLRNAHTHTHPGAILYNHISRVLNLSNKNTNNNNNHTNNKHANNTHANNNLKQFPLTLEIIKYTKRQQWLYNKITHKHN
ncbi:MAG: hypothetical protein EBU90_04495 [Proteobacteria bacterium]|nr:hypothetical protein [Pseudomonadota bacterium]NBP15018.1 hypothetical protein [bacterium]